MQFSFHSLPLCSFVVEGCPYPLLMVLQGLFYFCGTENHLNHGNWPKFRVMEIIENHGESRNWK